MVSNTPPATLDLLQYKVNQQAKELEELRAHVLALEERERKRMYERSVQERKQLMAGISFLGAIVLALGGVIWAYRAVIFRGS